MSDFRESMDAAQRQLGALRFANLIRETMGLSPEINAMILAKAGMLTDAELADKATFRAVNTGMSCQVIEG